MWRSPLGGVTRARRCMNLTWTWWRKQGEELREAIRERNRPKFGRMARLRGQVEQLAADKVGLVNAEVAENLETMRSEERAKLAAQ